jgi:LysR family transcriptional regulator, glycine cleavage system transcriptional activator
LRRPLPPLNALRAFEVAARHGSFRAAGDELCVSHSAISHQVKQLEEYLRLELFDRKSRSVELTKAGRALYPVLRETFDRIADCTDALVTPRLQDVLTVRLYSTLSVRWLIPRLPRFQATHPKIRFRLNSSQLDVDFEREDVDASVMIGQKTNDALHYTYLFATEVFPVCSPALRDAQIPLLNPSDLRGQTILQVYPSRRDWLYWLENVGVSNVDPDSGLIFDSYDHALSAAREGVGIALGMQPYVARDLAAGILVEAFPSLRIRFDSDWYFVCRKERCKEPKIAAFRTWLQQEIAADPDIVDLGSTRA